MKNMVAELEQIKRISLPLIYSQINWGVILPIQYMIEYP
jgi:hypothetical protein